MNEVAYSHSQGEGVQLESLPSPLKLLIIEDVPEDVELIVLTLESAYLDFTYDTTSTLDGCRQLLNTHAYDVVLSDYRLPNLNGLQVLDLLKESAQDIPFILITGSLGEEAAVECIKAGMTDYVLKDRLFRLPTVLERGLQEFELRRQKKAAIARIQQQMWRETIVNRIIQAMRETLVLEEVLQTTVDHLHEALQVSRCSIFQPITETKSSATRLNYVSRATHGRESLLGITCAFYDHYQERLVQDQPVIVHCVDQELPESMQTIAKSHNIQSAILMPLIYQRTYLGGICLQQCDRQRTWTEDEVALVKAVADQCAIAIHQAKLYQQAQTELAERQRIEAQLRHDAFHDSLTGLPNRALLMNRLEHSLLLAQRRLNRNPADPFQFAILFLDLDRFKVVNDSLGHTLGDQLLKVVAHRLQSCLRMGDTVARLGGDEFVVLLEDIQAVADAIEAANRIHQALKVPILLDGHEVFASTSIGIAVNASHYTKPEQLIRDADIAMYRAKKLGCGYFEVFDISMHTLMLNQLKLESDLQRAIDRQEFMVHYQPIVTLETQRIAGFEALVRWQHPEQGMVSPADFIPIAEETGLIMAIDRWVLREACRQLRSWQQEFASLPPLFISVNLSGKQFSRSDLIAQVDRVLEETGISGSQLTLEVTEGILIENSDVATAILKQLRTRQIQVSLDDFGTGYSSLSYLHRFPIDSLKIDRSFIASLETDVEKLEIVKAIVNLAMSLDLNVVAEGIETPQQLQYLQAIHCKAGQGYHFAPALDAQAASKFLQQQNLMGSSRCKRLLFW